VNDGKVFNKAFIGYNLNYNTLDDQKHPTSGVFAVFSQQYTGWDYNYLKSDLKARYFMGLGDTGMVASVKGQAGIINNFGSGAVSSLEAYKGGSSIVRGFEAGGFGPRLNGTVSGVPGEYLGYTEYAAGSAELQFPFPVLPESYGLSGAIWADAAYVNGTPSLGSGTLDTGSIDQPFKSSVGASVIWDSPFGPLRGDFGYVLTKATSDRTQLFQITLQTLL
jgi:outer membrane protein insertion porin family